MNVSVREQLSDFIFTSKYARYNEKLKRRETWDEAVDRLANMHYKKFKKISAKYLIEIEDAFKLVREKKVVPSMRSLQFGGLPIEKKNAKIFNCAVRHIDSIRSFAESFHCLLCGNGVGFGLSKHFLDRLPNLVSSEDKTGTVITYVVEDTIEGWADSVEALLQCYFKNTPYTGRKIVFDFSKIRKKGAQLKTCGGKAPGYKGLKASLIKIKDLLDSVIEELNQSRLKSINCYDILMHCADAVLSGGVRRSACSIIFDKDDEDMMSAKTFFKVEKKHRFGFNEDTNKHIGDIRVNGKKYHVELDDYNYKILQEEKKISWIYIEPQRARSNNSVMLIRDTTTIEDFKNIIQKSREFGEPGFVFSNEEKALFNPCFEVSFIPVTKDGQCGFQFCNLTSVNGSKIKTFEDFLKAVEAATIIGTCQAAYTRFDYLGKTAEELTEEEALLGVSITGLMDSPEVLLNPENQRNAAKYAVEVNKKWAKILGINPAARVTVVKPEGTASLVLCCGSGIHAEHSRKYIRRVQCNKTDNVYKHFKKHNPQVCEESVWSANKTDDVVSFPIDIPEETMLKSDLSALKHLDIIKSTQQNWILNGVGESNKKNIEHNVSCTVLVKENEWDDVINYLFENRKYFAAVSLLPDYGDKLYKQAPLEKMSTEEELKKFEEIKNSFKKVDYTKMIENDDETLLQQESACSGGNCEIVRV